MSGWPWHRPKPKPPPVVQKRAIAIWVTAVGGAPVGGASVRLDGHPEVQTTNGDGYACFVAVKEDLTQTHLFVTCPGYHDADKHLTLHPGPGSYDAPLLVPLVVPVPPPAGIVRLVHGALVDTRGPFNAIGASFFPAAWAWRHDRLRLIDNAALLAEGGIEYVRIWGQVAGGPWEDRATLPTWPDYEEVMAGTVDVLYDLGLRTQITIIAGCGAEGAATRAERDALVRRMLAIVRGREHKIMLLEVANEAVGFPGDEGRAEMRDHARTLAAHTDIPVAITSIDQSAPGLYEGMRGIADVSICHYDRDITKADGYDRPTRQPWGYPGEYYPQGYASVPPQAIDNEGIGPYASVASDMDPLRNVTRRVVAWIAGNPASLYHCGPGIYFGGQGGVRSGSPANFAEVPGIAETLRGFNVLRQRVPQGIAGWTRSNSGWANFPWVRVTQDGTEGAGCVRSYATDNGSQIVCVPFGIRDHVTLGEKQPMTWTVYSLLTGAVIQEGTGTLTLPQHDGLAQLILGRFM